MHGDEGTNLASMLVRRSISPASDVKEMECCPVPEISVLRPSMLLIIALVMFIFNMWRKSLRITLLALVSITYLMLPVSTMKQIGSDRVPGGIAGVAK